MQNDNPKVEFIPKFKLAFLHPRYWGIWLVVGVMVFLAFVPAAIRNPPVGALGRFVGRHAKSARRRARVNLSYCMPELNEQQREELIDKMFATAIQSFILVAEQAVRSKSYLKKRTRWHGIENIKKVEEQGRNVIFMVPHAWTVDIPAMVMASQGRKMAAMFHNQSNRLVDWLWNSVRRRFGGRMHARSDGIKSFIRSVQSGYAGFYLPDQDHGIEASVFVPYFATYKATLPVIGRLMKICNASMIPLFPVYRNEEGVLDIYIRPAMDDIIDADDETIARRMNEEIEILVRPNPEQYTWVLKLLKTRRPGDEDPYKRTDL